jgi:hypothetical protein
MLELLIPEIAPAQEEDKELSRPGYMRALLTNLQNMF